MSVKYMVTKELKEEYKTPNQREKHYEFYDTEELARKETEQPELKRTREYYEELFC